MMVIVCRRNLMEGGCGGTGETEGRVPRGHLGHLVTWSRGHMVTWYSHLVTWLFHHPVTM